MNTLISEEFGTYYARIPLTNAPHIAHGNALRIDWNDVLPAEHCSYMLGNPPFVGAKLLGEDQRKDVAIALTGIEGAGLLDLVAAWYAKAATYIQGTSIRCAFVSTNSITQGEQVGVLWGWLLAKGVHIIFAHRTFRWSNEARGMAAVHCVIIGFSMTDSPRKLIYEYDDIRGDGHATPAANINPYLVDAPDIILPRRSHSICSAPEIGIGNKPIDDGNYLFTPTEKREFIEREPNARGYFRRWLGASEFITGAERWFLWLGRCPPEELRKMPEAMKRVEAVRRFRLASKSAPTRKLAETPTQFHVENIPQGDYLVFPRHSSETRRFIPLGYFGANFLAGDACLIAQNVSTFEFGVLSSTMHNAWVRYTCGRIKSDFRYSASIVYNNFPWPGSPADAQKQKIEIAAQGVLDARTRFPDASLADLYDPLTMPPVLLKAHQALDAAVDAAYGLKSFKNDAERVAFLFELYQKYTSLLPAPAIGKKRRVQARKVGN